MIYYLELLLPQNIDGEVRIRIFSGFEKGTCAPNYHEQAFVQREETEDKTIHLLDVQGGFRERTGCPNHHQDGVW